MGAGATAELSRHGRSGQGGLQQFHLTGAALRSPSDVSRHVPGSDVLWPQALCCPASTFLVAVALLAGGSARW